MAKSIAIHYSDLTGPDPEKVVLTKAPAVTVDFSPLKEHYRQLGERHLQNVEEFVRYWRDGAEEACLEPAARIVVMTDETFRKTFGEALPLQRRPEGTVAMAVWTIGRELERRSSELTATNGERMKGLLLDVAGSMALFAIHDAVLQWFREGLAEPKGLALIDEFYPGFGGVNATLMEGIESLGRTSETIGVESRGASMLYPRKSQCSFIAIGEGVDGTRKDPLRCEPCLGARCLYYQLGGCHLTAKGGKP